MKRLRSKRKKLDNTDVQILVDLEVDERNRVEDLDSMVGLYTQTVSERIRRLEDAGVIEGYRDTIN